MAIEFKQNLRQSQNLLLSPQIQQAIKILTLGRAELQEFVSEELKENPCLEENYTKPENSETFDAPSSLAPGMTGSSSTAQSFDNEAPSDQLLSDADPNLADLGEALIAAVSKPSHGDSGSTSNTPDYEFDVPLYDNVRRTSQGLHEEVENQLRMMHLTEHELQSSLTVLQYINDDGYLVTNLDDICRENDLEADDVLNGLKLIQNCEPLGVGARNLQECLLLQLRGLPETPALAERIVRDFWSELEKVDVKKIARSMRVEVEDVKEAVRFIRAELDPRPARQYGDSHNQIVEPDVYIFMRQGQWVVSLNEDGLPRLRVSKHYEKLIHEIAGGKKSRQDAAVRNFVSTRIKSAKWLVRALAERNKTILRVTEVIATRQAAFLEKGVEGLKPLTLRQVADEIGLHESTVSRTTTNKYVQTPQGLFELKYFFNSAMTREDGEQLASETIRSWVGELIKAEDPGKPLSDQEIANTIAQSRNVPIARRTVAKYREALGIPSSSQRVRKF